MTEENPKDVHRIGMELARGTEPECNRFRNVRYAMMLGL
jgi:hypothetical protein